MWCFILLIVKKNFSYPLAVCNDLKKAEKHIDKLISKHYKGIDKEDQESPVDTTVEDSANITKGKLILSKSICDYQITYAILELPVE